MFWIRGFDLFKAESDEEPWQPLQKGSAAAFEFAEFKVSRHVRVKKKNRRDSSLYIL